MAEPQDHQFVTPLTCKYVHALGLVGLGALPPVALLVAWRVLAYKACDADSIHCDWAVVLLVLALVLGLGCTAVAVWLNSPEHRFYKTDSG